MARVFLIVSFGTMGPHPIIIGSKAQRIGVQRHAGGEPPYPGGAAAPDHKAKQHDAIGFTIPLTWQRGHPATRGAAASRRWQNFLCLGKHNRQRQRSERVQRHAAPPGARKRSGKSGGRTAILSLLPSRQPALVQQSARIARRPFPVLACQRRSAVWPWRLATRRQERVQQHAATI